MTSVKLKGAGVISAALLVTRNVPKLVPIVTEHASLMRKSASEVILAATTKVPVADVVTVLEEAKVPLSDEVPASTVPFDTVIVNEVDGSKPVTVTVFDV